jgi:hypothetical protein
VKRREAYPLLWFAKIIIDQTIHEIKHKKIRNLEKFLSAK